jgi:GST-like protein
MSAEAAVGVRQPPASLDLYYWPTPNGWKITILLEELGERYNLVPVDIRKGAQFQPDFLRISPNNKIPAIVDRAPCDGGAPIALFESAVILTYLAEKHGKFRPSRLRERCEVDQWLAWQIAALGPTAGQVHHFREYAPASVPYAIDRFTNEINRLYGVLNVRLADRDFLAGDYSIADIACWVWIRLWRHHAQKLDDFPHLRRWFEVLAERPAVDRGFRIGNELREGKSGMTEAERLVLLGQRARMPPT